MSHSSPSAQSLALDQFLGDALSSLPRAGRPSVPPKLVRELSHDDLASLAGAKGSTQGHIVKIREHHHEMARLLAEGMKAVEVSAACGITQNRLSILGADPSFRELIEHYKRQKSVRMMSMHDRLNRVGTMALDILAERLEDDPEGIETKELNELVKSTLDRAGFGPTTRHEHNLTGTATLSVIAAIKAEARGGSVRQLQDIVDAEVRELSAPETISCESSEG